jgi:hypothetical protein
MVTAPGAGDRTILSAPAVRDTERHAGQRHHLPTVIRADSSGADPDTVRVTSVSAE